MENSNEKVDILGVELEISKNEMDSIKPFNGLIDMLIGEAVRMGADEALIREEVKSVFEESYLEEKIKLEDSYIPPKMPTI